MRILGLQKTTLLDYPGHVAATIFLGGCNFRCPFCHNMDIVEGGTYKDLNTYSEEEIIKFLNKREGILEGVCITGGEPTMYTGLPEFIRKIKKINGYLVKLDTNGSNPEMLKMLIDEELIDYVAMDIKSSIEKYHLVAGLNRMNLSDSNEKILVDNILKSIEILKNSSLEYEFRTTVVKEYHDREDILSIAKMISGAKRYYLQSFSDSDYVPDHSLNAPDKSELEEFRGILKEYVDTVEIRGVD